MHQVSSLSSLLLLLLLLWVIISIIITVAVIVQHSVDVMIAGNKSRARPQRASSKRAAKAIAGSVAAIDLNDDSDKNGSDNDGSDMNDDSDKENSGELHTLLMSQQDLCQGVAGPGCTSAMTSLNDCAMMCKGVPTCHQKSHAVVDT